MRTMKLSPTLSLLLTFLLAAPAFAQEKKLERIRVGGGSASATQMSMWLAKEAGLYEKNGLSVEAISIPGSSLALQAMLAGEVPIIQLGGGASIAANFSGADTVIVATIVRKFLFSIFARPGIERMEDLRGKIFGATRFGTLSDLASRLAPRVFRTAPGRGIATLQARRLKLKEILDLSKLDVEYHVNGVVTSRSYLKTHEDTVRRFLRAYIEGAARGQRDKAFAMKAMGKYFRTDDKELLEETYESVIKAFSIPPYPSIRGIANLLDRKSTRLNSSH